MRPGMQCLLGLLRDQSCAATAPHEWQSALALAEEHRVLPFLAHKLLENRTTVPPGVNEHLLRARREALHYAFLQTSELKGLLRAFAAAKAPALPLKGPFLAQRLYGSSSLRISSDLDLLVPKLRFPAAALLLQSQGLVPDSVPDDYHQKWTRASTVVELHFNVENPLAIDFDIEAVWQNARLASFEGQPAWQLAPEDELAYLCLHAARHRFDRLTLILDIALALPTHTGTPASDGFTVDPGVAHSKSRDAHRLLALGCAMVQKLYPELPGLITPSKHTQSLADRLWNDLLTQKPRAQDWPSMHRFYLETEPTLWRKLLRRIRYAHILLTRLNEEDHRFAARFGLRRPWQIQLLRPVRLAFKRPA